MATNETLKNQIAKKRNVNQNTPQGYTIKQLMRAEVLSERSGI